MGLSDFLRRRRERESALPGQQPTESLGSFASPEGQPVVGQQLGGGQVAEGNVQIEHGGSQTIDMRGTGMREEILGIMQAHGIDPESGSASIDASSYGDMQQQLLDVLAKHGIDPGASGTSLNFQIEQKDE